MLLSSPVWRGSSRWWFVTGLVAGGLASAAVAGGIGLMVLRPFLPLPAAGAGAAAAFGVIAAGELGWVRLPLPQNKRQVPQSIVDGGSRFGPLQFGFEMGTGVRTYMTSGLPHALLAAVVLLGSRPAALAAGTGFGLGRAAMPLGRLWHHDNEAWDSALHRFERWIRVILTLAAGLALTSIILSKLWRP